MDEAPKIGLDNPAFAGRLRQPVEPVPPRQAVVTPVPRTQAVPPDSQPAHELKLTPLLTPTSDPVSAEPTDPATQPVVPPAPDLPAAPVVEPPAMPPQDVAVPVKVIQKVSEPEAADPEPQPATVLPVEPAVVKPEPFVQPALPKLQPSNVLRRPAGGFPQTKQLVAQLNLRHYSGLQVGLAAVAALVFLFGVGLSWQTIRVNHTTASQLGALTDKAASEDIGLGPQISHLGVNALSQYTVAADQARYLQVPRFEVSTRVLPVSLKTNGGLGTPDNIHDVAWYNGSSKPGQAGAVLIDGYASSQGIRGALYQANALVAGDVVQVVRGDKVTVTYRVVKTQSYAAENVDMDAALAPVTAGKPGLNIMIYGGYQTPGTDKFSQRVIVFTEQV